MLNHACAIAHVHNLEMCEIAKCDGGMKAKNEGSLEQVQLSVDGVPGSPLGVEAAEKSATRVRGRARAIGSQQNHVDVGDGVVAMEWQEPCGES